MNLTHLEHFLAIAVHGSFSRAAVAVHLSPSALSRSIRALEVSLGRPLLLRRYGGTELTAYGHAVRKYAEILLRERQRLLDAIEQTDLSGAGELRVGLGVYMAELSGIEAAASLSESGQPLPYLLRIGDYLQIPQDLKARKIDLGFCDLSAARNDKELRCQPLPQHQLFAYTRPGHPLLSNGPVTFEALFQYPVIGIGIRALKPGAPGSRAEHFDSLTGEWLPTLNTVTPGLALKLLRVTDAIAFAPLLMIEDLLAAGQAALVPARLPQLQLQPGFISLAEYEFGPLAQRYIDQVIALESKLMQRSRVLESRYGVEVK